MTVLSSAIDYAPLDLNSMTCVFGNQPLKLPPPHREFASSLAQALRRRRSTREFSSRPLPVQVLSDLLWAAYGINRPATGDRTAPSWRHALETEIFIAMPSGVWRYVPETNCIVPHVQGDIRAQTGTQDFVGTAPIDLLFVANGAHLVDIDSSEQHRVASADAGFIGQNVYLYCASEGLACVFRGSLDTKRLAQLLKLDAGRFVTFAQTVGYPVAS